MTIEDFIPITKEDRLLIHNAEITLDVISSLPKELNISEPSISIDGSGQLITIVVCIGGMMIEYKVTKDDTQWYRIKSR